jgi:hypothetical protein
MERRQDRPSDEMHGLRRRWLRTRDAMHRPADSASGPRRSAQEAIHVGAGADLPGEGGDRRTGRS